MFGGNYIISTTLFDKENQEIFESSIIEYYDENYHSEPRYYRVKFGHGTYDSGYYNFIGFYLVQCNQDGSKYNDYSYTDGTANILFDKEHIRIIT